MALIPRSPLTSNVAFKLIKLPAPNASMVSVKIVPAADTLPVRAILPVFAEAVSPKVTTVPNPVIISFVLSFQIPNVFSFVIAVKFRLI